MSFFFKKTQPFKYRQGHVFYTKKHNPAANLLQKNDICKHMPFFFMKNRFSAT